MSTLLLTTNTHGPQVSKLESFVDSLFQLRQKIREMQDQEKTVAEELKLSLSEFDPEQAHKTYRFSSYSVSLMEGTNRRLERDKLLFLGVKPEVLEAATVTSTYRQLRIQPVVKK